MRKVDKSIENLIDSVPVAISKQTLYWRWLTIHSYFRPQTRTSEVNLRDFQRLIVNEIQDEQS